MHSSRRRIASIARGRKLSLGDESYVAAAVVPLSLQVEQKEAPEMPIPIESIM